MHGTNDALFHVSQAIHRDLLLTPASVPMRTENLSTLIARIEARRMRYLPANDGELPLR
jgi:hypothetical protein